MNNNFNDLLLDLRIRISCRVKFNLIWFVWRSVCYEVRIKILIWNICFVSLIRKFNLSFWLIRISIIILFCDLCFWHFSILRTFFTIILWNKFMPFKSIHWRFFHEFFIFFFKCMCLSVRTFSLFLNFFNFFLSVNRIETSFLAKSILKQNISFIIFTFNSNGWLLSSSN